LVAHKTTARANHEVAAAYARSLGCQEAVWLDPVRRLTEGTITNLFVCRRGRVLTPSGECGLLPGIARGRLLAVRRLAGHPVEEADLRPQDLADSDEVFLTNAVRGAIPVLAWEGVPLRRGPLWQAAVEAIFSGTRC
jgi:branched-subunit amino acid aminotransferase/4-amino-4-deoxychorismate lyase